MKGVVCVRRMLLSHGGGGVEDDRSMQEVRPRVRVGVHTRRHLLQPPLC